MRTLLTATLGYAELLTSGDNVECDENGREAVDRILRDEHLFRRGYGHISARDRTRTWYTLELFNVQHPTNTQNARVTIVHAGATETRTLDQRNTANGFVTLGRFYFDGSATQAITLQNLGAGNLRADALRIRATPPPGPFTVDNGQSGHSEFGVWADSGLTGQNGSSTRFTTQTGAGATYRPPNLVAGFYVVEVYNVQHPSNTTNARVTIKHAGVTETLTLDLVLSVTAV